MASVIVEKAWEAGSADYAAASDRSGSQSRATSVEVPYIVSGAADECAAAEAAYGQSAASVSGLSRKTVSVRERLGESRWKVSVRYEKSDKKGKGSGGDDADDGVRWSFSSGGATQHVDSPLSNVLTVKNPAIQGEVSHPGVIEPDEDGRPRGIDIPVPQLRVTLSCVLRNSEMTQGLKLLLAEYVGSINLRSYHGFRPGELRYDGAEFSDRENDDGDTVWDLSMNFSYSPTQFNVDCGSGVKVPAKAGWDYLWKEVQTAVRDGKVYRRVKAAYVDRVYPVRDFGGLPA